jgi:toxin-antitoxin system PIN domain toxin
MRRSHRRIALCDVNVLIALFDESHVHHEAAHDWFADDGSAGWASCATTETGFLRILGNPRLGVTETRDVLLTSLRKLCKASAHTFWSESVSLRDDTLFDDSVLVSHRQLTDVYLLGLAVRMDGRLATFDRSIPLAAVKGALADQHLVVLGAA